MTAEVIHLDSRRLTPFLVDAIEGFLKDPPDTEYQQGFLAALCLIWREGINGNPNDARIAAAEKLVGVAI